MVKFAKYMDSHFKEEWKDYYINYKILKNHIKELKELQDKEVQNVEISSKDILKTVDVQEELKMIDVLRDLGITEHLEYQLKGKSEKEQELVKKKYLAIGKYVKDFLSMMDTEVQKFNEFYHKLEKYIRDDFINLKKQMLEIHTASHVKEILELVENIDAFADKIISVCQYVNINITAIRKILKKFDKKFDTKENPIALHYLKKNLSKSNSSLVYILQFKIIDEASALLDRMVITLEESIFSRGRMGKSQTEEFLQEPLLLKEINIDELSGSEINQNIINVIKKKFNKIKKKLEKIDDSNNLIRSGIEVWSLIIKNNIRVVDDYFKSKASLKKMTMEAMQQVILEKLTPQLQREEEFHMTLSQKINIWIVLMHTFIYTMNCYIVQPTNSIYISELGADKTLSGLIMGLTHFAAIFCTFFYSFWTNYSYKLPLLISCLSFIIGNLFYSLAEYYQSLLMMGAGRFLIGFASARVVNRRYIIDYVPTQLIMLFSLLYVGLTCLGMAAGPFVALILLHFFPGEETLYNLKFNANTNPGWFSAALWVLFTLAVLFLFKDPDAEMKSSVDRQNTHMRSMSESSSININDAVVSPNNLKTTKTRSGSSTGDFEQDVEEIIHEEEMSFSYMSIAFTILIAILLIIRVI